MSESLIRTQSSLLASLHLGSGMNALSKLKMSLGALRIIIILPWFDQMKRISDGEELLEIGG